MDPDATLRNLLDALDQPFLDDAAEHAQNLAEWLNRDGFAPRWPADDPARNLDRVFAALHGRESVAVQASRLFWAIDALDANPADRQRALALRVAANALAWAIEKNLSEN